MEPDLHKRH